MSEERMTGEGKWRGGGGRKKMGRGRGEETLALCSLSVRCCVCI